MTGEVVLVLRILGAACLYAFLGWAFFTLWKDLRQQSQAIGSRKVPPLMLSWDSQGKNIEREYTNPRITLGRDPSSDCPLLHETVSAHHAALSYHHRQWWLEDLKSTNGTFLNDEKVETPTVIVSGDEIRCGQVPVGVEINIRTASPERSR